jgi:predicted polyphosphate/ATP-dependent NAD kinase
MKLIGFVVNPIAGMGGAVGLKGTDGKEVLQKAITLGAEPIAPSRARGFLSELKPVKDKIKLLTGAGKMGEEIVREIGFAYSVIGSRNVETTADDTKDFAKKMLKENVDLLVFCGGDGTARDIRDVVNVKVPVLGVPTGVKMESAVFAVNPKAAARIISLMLNNRVALRESEVMDVDEEAFRRGKLSSQLYGYMLTPYVPELIQTSKIATPSVATEMRNQAAIALYVIDEMKQDTLYILGPGTTTRTVSDLLDEKKTLLGADVLLNKKMIAYDVNEEQILKAVATKDAKIVVTPIGGQGFIFGRGNQQISPLVIRRVGLENIIVIATKFKMKGLQKLRVDTGDVKLDEEMKGEIEVIIDYDMKKFFKVE